MLRAGNSVLSEDSCGFASVHEELANPQDKNCEFSFPAFLARGKRSYSLERESSLAQAHFLLSLEQAVGVRLAEFY